VTEEKYPLWSLDELVEMICTRPRMFVYNADFLQLASYVNGYAAGRGYFLELRDFQSWLADKYYAAKKIPRRNMVWDDVVKMATEPDSSELETFYNEYMLYKLRPSS
jgi:hypothetical protein